MGSKCEGDSYLRETCNCGFGDGHLLFPLPPDNRLTHLDIHIPHPHNPTVHRGDIKPLHGLYPTHGPA